MRLKFTPKGDGPGPSEAIVAIATLTGTEQIVLSSRKAAGGFVEVGDPLLVSDNRDAFLVELPRETASGRWRVWVKASEVADSYIAAAE